MANSTQTETPLETRGYTETIIPSMTGFTLFSAMMLISAYSPLLATASTNTPEMHGITHGIMFAIMFFVYFALSRHFSNRDVFIRSRVAQIIFFLLGALLPVACLIETFFGYSLPEFFILLFWALLGLSYGFFSCTWTDIQNFFNEERIKAINLWCFGMAGCITAAILAMPTSTGLVAFMFLNVGSFLFLLQTPTPTSTIMSQHDEKWFTKSSHYSTNGSYIMFVDGVLLGIVAGLIIARISKGALVAPIIGIAFILVALIFYVIEKKRPALLALGVSQLVFLPILICFTILSGFLSAPWNTVAAIPLFIILYLFDYTNHTVLSLRGSLLAISPCYCFSKGRIFIISGQAAGWFIGAFLASDIGHGSLPAISVVLIVLMCLYITISVIKPGKYSVVNEDASVQQPVSESASVQGEQTIRQPFKQKCSLAISTYNLTPREGEILFYLAKGRNAKYIADQLYVAERTVKTHTYHIYQKMEIHSQQELIDIIENKMSDEQ